MADRYWDRERDWDRGRRYRGEGYYGAPSDFDDRDRDRGYDRRFDERGILDRLRDEVRSWFNDEPEERWRGRDERDRGRWGGSEESARDWARQWGHIEGRGRRRPEYDWGYGVGTGRGRLDEYETPRSWDRGAEPPRSGGAFAGLGPRGYRRSDERIREDICEQMCDNARLDASDIEIVVVGGEVTLTGSVHERSDKRLAEDLTENVSGVREVHNQLRVSGAREQDPGSQTRPGESPRYRVA
jgi:hypothetical protein